MKDEKVETLNLDDTLNMSKTDALDFEDLSDEEISNKIDNMLDFTIHKDPSSLNELLAKSKDEDKKIEIDVAEEKLNEYKPSIKDFNIKSARARKIVYKLMLYIIIIMLAGFEFFLNKSGDILKNIRVYASDNQPIKIVQNNKYGFIDKVGNVLVNPKYNYADDFVKGYAIVKNSSNLPLIINKGGKEVVPSGTYFTIYRAGSDIVASKATKAGLKYGIYDENLKMKSNFDYDSIYYSGDLYTYIKGEEVGVLNKDGKEIYHYKLTENDEKAIDVSVSKIKTDDTKYAVAKVNGTSVIINSKTGKIVSAPTLGKIIAEENNVFYEISSNNTKKYMYVKDDKLLIDTSGYKNLEVPSIKSGVIKAINNSNSYEFISTNTLEQIKKELANDDAYYGDNIFIYKERNYVKNVNTLVFIKDGVEISRIEGDFEVYKPFKNGYAILKYSDGTYGYVDESGKLINDEHYMEANEFDTYGDAIVRKNTGYGVLNKNGKMRIDAENNEIRMISGDLKKSLKSISNNVFYAVKKDNKFILYNSKLKRRDDRYYDDIIFDDNYPVFKAATDTLDLIITSEKLNEITLTSFNTDYKAYETYIVVKNEYYNYSGKLIYTDKSNDYGGDNSE